MGTQSKPSVRELPKRRTDLSILYREEALVVVVVAAVIF